MNGANTQPDSNVLVATKRNHDPGLPVYLGGSLPGSPNQPQSFSVSMKYCLA